MVRWVLLLLWSAILPLAAPAADPPTDAAKREVARLHEQATKSFDAGRLAEAADLEARSVQLCRTVYPAAQHPHGHPELADRLNYLGFYLQAAGSLEPARKAFEEALAIRKAQFPPDQFPQGHPQLATALNNLGYVLKLLGDLEAARPYYEQSLAMKQKLLPADKYPTGHPSLALALSNVARLLEAMGSAAAARPYYEQALAMQRKLYPPDQFPQGHRDLASALNNLASSFHNTGEFAAARKHHEEALAMRRKLYPTSQFPLGHRDVANSLNNLATLLADAGDWAEARKYQDEAVAAYRKLFPAEQYAAGHPELALSLANAGAVLLALGQRREAVPYFAEALDLEQKLLQRNLTTAADAEARQMLEGQGRTLNSYLTATAGPDAPADAYARVWTAKATVTRLAERRRLATQLELRQTTTPALQRTYADWLLANRRLTQLLYAPPSDSTARDQLHRTLTAEKDRLERDLARALPDFGRLQVRADQSPADLTKALPDHAAFVDFFRYVHVTIDRTKPVGEQKVYAPAYVAFVLARGQQPRRVDLGDAGLIDAAVVFWRKAIAERTPPVVQKPTKELTTFPEMLAERLWQPIARHLPPETRTLYLSPDSFLARLPWAALPGRKPGTVLLEDYAGGIALVPHGQYLLERLAQPAKAEGPEAVLALGAVDYGTGGKTTEYPALPGTGQEVEQLQTLAGSRPLTLLTGTDATPARLRAALPQVRFAHLATHGFFAQDEMAADYRRHFEAMKNWRPGQEAPGAARVLPEAYTGLVLAGANAKPGEGVLTSLDLLGLGLENLGLVVLSTCETGLGDMTGAEGVQGLQRAFHLAGCPNVVASLWKVNDAATAALMAKFYHELWVNQKPPLEALREAQLTIYRRPDLIADLAGERGAPKLKEAVAIKSGDPLPKDVVGKKTADTKLWASFVLSGVGK